MEDWFVPMENVKSFDDGYDRVGRLERSEVIV